MFPLLALIIIINLHWRIAVATSIEHIEWAVIIASSSHLHLNSFLFFDFALFCSFFSNINLFYVGMEQWPLGGVPMILNGFLRPTSNLFAISHHLFPTFWWAFIRTSSKVHESFYRINRQKKCGWIYTWNYRGQMNQNWAPLCFVACYKLMNIFT